MSDGASITLPAIDPGRRFGRSPCDSAPACSERAERPLRVLHVSAADHMGGAEQVGHMLFDAQRARGHEAWMAVGKRTREHPAVFEIPNDRRRHAWARACEAAAAALEPMSNVKGIKRVQLTLRETIGQPMRTRARKRGEEDFEFPGTAELLSLAPAMPHLVHLHNLHSPRGYFDLRRLPEISRRVPTIVTLHDAWLLAGHCAHSFECERWRTGCGACPDLSIYPPVDRDATAFNWRRKRDVFAASRVYVSACSQWLLDRARESLVSPAIVEGRVIYNGVDRSIFCPGDQVEARAAVGLPVDGPVLLFAANGVRNNCFKDFKTMRASLAIVAERWAGPAVTFVALGEDCPPEQVGRATIRFVPFQRDPNVVAQYHRAADVYLHAARADSLPIAILEAFACGRSVVASRVSGIPEQIEEGVNGHMAPVGDAETFAARVLELLADPVKRAAMGERGAALVAEKFDVRQQVEAYEKWYREILEREGGRTSR